MKLKNIYNGIVKAVLLSVALNAQAETSDNTIITRLDTKISPNSCVQKLPNIVTISKTNSWDIKGAIKIDNLSSSEGCFGENDARLFFLNGTYKGLERQGISLKLGLFAPDELTQYPMEKGFSSVVMDDYALYGGIVGGKLDKAINISEYANLTINTGIGYKPKELKGFGLSSDLVVSAGLSMEHNFSGSLTARFGYQYINISTPDNQENKDHYTYGELKLDKGSVKFKAFAENVNGENNKASFSALSSLSSKTDWRIAVGTNNNEENLEINLYHDFNRGVKGTLGFGNNFETKQNVAQIGFIKKF